MTPAAQQIRAILAELKSTQAGMAEKLQVSPRTLRQWVNDEQKPPAWIMLMIRACVEVPGFYRWLQKQQKD